MVLSRSRRFAKPSNDTPRERGPSLTAVRPRHVSARVTAHCHDGRSFRADKRREKPMNKTTLFALAALWMTAQPALAADACSNRGELDTMYCDANKDLVADVPTDPKKWKNPS